VNHRQGVSSDKPLDFTFGHFPGITPHAPFTSTIRYVHHGTFPRHPSRQCPHLIDVYIRSKAYTAFGWTKNVGVNYPYAFEDLDFSIVHSDRKGYDYLFGWIFQDIVHLI